MRTGARGPGPAPRRAYGSTLARAGMAVIFAPLSVGIILLTLLAGVLAVRGAVALTAIGGMLKLAKAR